MDRIPLQAEEREILGKKVKNLRKIGLIPGHVFGNKKVTEHVSVLAVDFLKVYRQTGETGLIDLKIGSEKVRPVLVREIQVHAVTDIPLHIDFYEVNMSEKVKVKVPIELIGEQPELVGAGEAVVIQPISEVEVEALPANLPEKIEVDISILKVINDSVTISQLKVPEGVEVLADKDAVVVKLDNAITEEMKKLMEEQAAETAAAAAAAVPEGGETPAEGAEGEVPAGDEAAPKAGEAGESTGEKESAEKKEEAPKE